MSLYKNSEDEEWGCMKPITKRDIQKLIEFKVNKKQLSSSERFFLKRAHDYLLDSRYYLINNMNRDKHLGFCKLD